VVHFVAAEDDDAGLSVVVEETLDPVPVELPEPEPEPSPVVVELLVVVVVLLLDDAGVSVFVVDAVELLALDDDAAGAVGAGMFVVTHLPLIGSQ
jgi:hypothetical protein